jgi:hypothetical protein
MTTGVTASRVAVDLTLALISGTDVLGRDTAD